MRNSTTVCILLLVLALTWASPSDALVRISLDGQKTHTPGEAVEIAPGEIYDEDIAVVGGKVRILGSVDGDVVVVMGKLELGGHVDGDVVTVMTDVTLKPGAEVHGDWVRVLGSLTREGEVHMPVGGKRTVVGVPSVVHIGKSSGILPWFLFSFALTVLGLILLVLVVGLFPHRVEAMARAMEEPQRWLTAPLTGLGALVALPLVTIALCVSIVGIILVPPVWIAYWLVSYFGIAAIYLVVGRRFLRNVAGGGRGSLVGPVVLVYLLVSIPCFIPCLGFLICLVLSWFGVGLALLTCFGRPGGWEGLGGGRRVTVRAQTRIDDAPPEEPPAAEEEAPEEEEEEEEEPEG